MQWLQHLADSGLSIPRSAGVPSAGCSKLHLHSQGSQFLQAGLCRSLGKSPAQRKLFKSCASAAFQAPQGWLQWQGQLWVSVEDGYQRTPLCSGSFIWMTNLNPLAAPTEVISTYLGQAKSGICLLLPLECTFPYSSIRLYEHTAIHRGQYI